MDGLRSSPALRRLAAAALVAALAALAWFTVRQAPVQSRMVVTLAGSWPPVRCVTLAYFETESREVLRRVRAFPPSSVRSVDDAPRLAPGAYRLQVTVETRGGTREYERVFEHGPGDEHHVDLRYGGE
jgi:hypothetical protein